MKYEEKWEIISDQIIERVKHQLKTDKELYDMFEWDLHGKYDENNESDFNIKLTDNSVKEILYRLICKDILHT